MEGLKANRYQVGVTGGNFLNGDVLCSQRIGYLSWRYKDRH